MDQLISLTCIIGFIAYGWPGFRTPAERVALVALVVLLPIVGWIYVARRGYRARRGAAIGRRALAQAEATRRHAESVQFHRWMLEHGTPLEQTNARELLTMWGYTPAPAGDHCPLVTTSRADLDHLSRYKDQPERVCCLPSGRRLDADEMVRFRHHGVLYIPRGLLI